MGNFLRLFCPDNQSGYRTITPSQSTADSANAINPVSPRAIMVSMGIIGILVAAGLSYGPILAHEGLKNNDDDGLKAGLGLTLSIVIAACLLASVSCLALAAANWVSEKMCAPKNDPERGEARGLLTAAAAPVPVSASAEQPEPARSPSPRP